MIRESDLSNLVPVFDNTLQQSDWLIINKLNGAPTQDPAVHSLCLSKPALGADDHRCQ